METPPKFSESSNELHTQIAMSLMGDARLALSRGAVTEAMALMSKARDAAELTNDAQLRVDAHTRAAIVFNYARRHEIALEVIAVAEKIARESGLSQNSINKTITNRAAFLLDSGFLKKSETTLLSLVSEMSTPAPSSTELTSVCNLVYVSLLAGKTRSALQWAEKFVALQLQSTDKIDFAVITAFECWYATALAMSGRHEDAAYRLAEIRELIPLENFILQTKFSIALGVSEVHAGMRDQGLTRLQDVTQLAEEKNVNFAEALQALTLVYEHVGDIASALACVEKLEKVMKEGARDIVGIDDEDDETRRAEEEANNKKGAKGGSSDGEIMDEAEDPTNSAIQLLDDRAAELRIKRFMELAQDERASVLDQIAVASALVDDETGKHCARVELLVYQFARALNLPERRARLIAAGARMHDLGKVGIPHRVLLAPRKLTPMEYEIAKKHVNIGVDLLSFSDHEVVRMAKVIAQNHHERWDGTGYPRRLFEDAIPIEARITSIVDVFDVLTHSRAYKRAWSVEQTRDELAFHAGAAFDPDLMTIFLSEVVPINYVIPTVFAKERPMAFTL